MHTEKPVMPNLKYVSDIYSSTTTLMQAICPLHLTPV